MLLFLALAHRLRALLAGAAAAGRRGLDAVGARTVLSRAAVTLARLRRERLPPGRDLLRAGGVGVAAFLLVNVAGEAIRAPFDTLGDWVSWPRDPGLRRALAVVVAAALIANAVVRSRPAWQRFGSALVLAGVAAAASVDVARFVRVVDRGRVIAPSVVPASALVAIFFGALAWETVSARTPAGAPSSPRRRRDRLLRLAMIGAVLTALPLVRMATFGPSRYERTADCAVVFGARVWRTGRPSDALADRVDEAIRLYKRGLVSRIVMSGAIDDDAGFSEPAVMARRAEDAGVPREAILLDEAGVDTASTARSTSRIMRKEGLRTALLVTHYYHEPRAKMLFDREGVRTYTVPARMSRRLRKEPYFLAREVAAYYHSLLLD